MKNSTVTITVAIPTFNRLKLLKKTIKSVRNQTVQPDEVIIVDNNSDQKTWEYIRSLGFKTYRHKQNIGSIQNINACFQNATSEYVVVLSSDDIILSDFIATWKKIIVHAAKNVVAFTSAGYIIDEKDVVQGIVRPYSKDILLAPEESLRFFWSHFYFTLPLGGWTVFKKEIFQKVGYYQYRGRAEESEMTVKVLSHYPIYYCSKLLFAYRIHPGQGLVNKEGDASRNNYIDVPKSALQILLSYEDTIGIRQAFTAKEQRNRYFIRQPIMFSLVVSTFYLLTGELEKAKNFYILFKDNYPRPMMSLLSVNIFTLWGLHLMKEYIINISIRLKRKSIK